MREWVASLEEILDNKLRKWRKISHIENGEDVQLTWQWEQSHVHIDVFWQDEKESVHIRLTTPRSSHEYHWHGLNDKTFNKVMDRVGNLVQVIMNPPIDPTDRELPPD